MPAAAATPVRVANMTSMETVQLCTVVESKQRGRAVKIAASEMTHTTDGSVGKNELVEYDSAVQSSALSRGV